MTDLLTSTLDHLQALVAFDTRNPPRAIAAEGGIFDTCVRSCRGLRPRWSITVQVR